jgi:hypothetical protein
MILRAVGSDMFSDVEISEAVILPLYASNRSKIVTRSFDAVGRFYVRKIQPFKESK